MNQNTEIAIKELEKKKEALRNKFFEDAETIDNAIKLLKGIGDLYTSDGISSENKEGNVSSVISDNKHLKETSTLTKETSLVDKEDEENLRGQILNCMSQVNGPMTNIQITACLYGQPAEIGEEAFNAKSTRVSRAITGLRGMNKITQSNKSRRYAEWIIVE